MYTLEGKKGTYEVVIGLEVHAQMLTQSKLFCSCSTTFGKSPNQNTCPVCLALPGVLPVLNKKVAEFAVKAGFATQSTIARKSVFARKNYFYPDLPKGYQISQYELPICQHGKLTVDVEEEGSQNSGKETKTFGITRIHIEEDAGKLLHEHPEHRSSDSTWVDLNRAGVPLLEIVSEPEMRSPQDAVAYLKKLRQTLIYLGVCDGNMEEGSLRCDANVSVRFVGSKDFGTRTETKNLNSFKHIEKAIHYEATRQIEVLEDGGRIVQETRLWDPDQEKTYSMRSKEDAHDYRYFPDPDLLPLVIEESWIEEIKQSLPELPDTKKARFISDYQLAPYDADILTSLKKLADFFEACLKNYQQPKKVAAWIINEYMRLIKADETMIESTLLKPHHVSETLKLVDDGTISGSASKTVLAKIFETGLSPKEIIEKEGLAQVSDDSALEAEIDKIIANSPKEVERFKAGNDKLLGFFVGQVMKAMQGRANPGKLNELVKKKLSS